MLIPFPAGVPGGPWRCPARRPAPRPDRSPAGPGWLPVPGWTPAECVELRTRQLVVQSGECGILRTRVLAFFDRVPHSFSSGSAPGSRPRSRSWTGDRSLS